MAKAVIPSWDKLTKLVQLASSEVIVYSPFYTRKGLDVISSLGESVSLKFCTKLILRDWSLGVSDPLSLVGMLSRLKDAGHDVMLLINQSLHAKAFYADRKYGLVGSANLTGGGFGANVEVMLFVKGTEAGQIIGKLEKQCHPGAREVSIEKLGQWVEQFRGVARKGKKSYRSLKSTWLDSQLEADAALGLVGGVRHIPIPTREMCDHFAAWLEAHEELPGAKILFVHATHKEERYKRYGHFRKCFVALYRFFHEYHYWQPILVSHLSNQADRRQWQQVLAKLPWGEEPDLYYTPSTDLTADWMLHLQSNAGLVENTVCDYRVLDGYLPPSFGGSRSRGGGAIATLRRMFPLLAYYLDAGMV